MQWCWHGEQVAIAFSALGKWEWTTQIKDLNFINGQTARTCRQGVY